VTDLTIMTTEVVVNLLPEWHTEAYDFRVYVQYRGLGRWAVVHKGEHLGHDGLWSYPPRGDSRDWLDEHRFSSFDAALEAAKEVAPTVEVDGVTAAQVRARMDARHYDDK
jgi:hypothetical protein